jgi:membrane protein DedA with SNARE-associated domain
MDCLTTVVGTLFFGTRELNPIIAQLVHTNIAAFVGVKLAATIGVGIILIVAEKILIKNSNTQDQNYKTARNILRGAYVAISVFLAIVVLNNVFVLAQLA